MRTNEDTWHVGEGNWRLDLPLNVLGKLQNKVDVGFLLRSKEDACNAATMKIRESLKVISPMGCIVANDVSSYALISANEKSSKRM